MSYNYPPAPLPRGSYVQIHHGARHGLQSRRHIEVGDIEQALEFYTRIVDFKLRRKSEDMAFDLGGQFLALQKGHPLDYGSAARSKLAKLTCGK
jgi:hypothetical protein